jgi:NADH:ubiquinone oxidoreductase subunit 6 (subunit J)
VSLAADYPFLEVTWTIFIFFAWVMVVAFVIMCLVDNFRRRDHSGWAKAGWTLLLILLPLFGAIVYQIARPKDVPFDGNSGTVAADGPDYATPTTARDEATRVRTGLQ